MTCTQCGAALTADDVFCNKCGAHAAANLPVPTDPLRAALERALGAQYDIQRLLGRGGMGAVYLARERSLDRLVAIKIIRPELATAAADERFRREARTAAKLTHPNIVPLHSFGDAEGMLYFVMGYVRGESLAERMRREGKLPEEDVRRILAEVADALHYAHKLGVVHRDIKPDNILLEDESGRPMLTDFGVAKARASGATLTEAGAVVGTPYYMSPEQASGARDIDGRSDLYSLGVMGYQMLAGRLPFEGESFQDVIVQHVTKEPAPLSALVPDVPPDLTAAVMRCLAKEPAKRWADAQGLRDAIRTGGDSEDYDSSAPGTEAENLVFSESVLIAGTGVLALLMLAFPGFRFFGDEPWFFWPATLGIGGVVLGPILVMVASRQRGTPWPTLLRHALFPPRWWPFWWPKGWRRPHDVWCRFPPVLRGLRWLTLWGALFFFGLFLASILSMGLMARHPELARMLKRIGIDAALPGILGMCASWVITGRWGMARGLTANDAYRLVSVSPMTAAFWNRPKFAALLLPPAGRAKTAQPVAPRSPAELAHAIRDLAGQFPSDTRVAVSEAGEAARQVADLIASLDAELANLARDADPQELEAVEAKLRALGPEAPDEGDVRRQKRTLLVNQRDLLRRLDARLATLGERRARLVDLMRTMWLQLATLRAEAARDTLAVTEISGRIKALCTEIDAHVQAAATVRLEIL